MDLMKNRFLGLMLLGIALLAGIIVVEPHAYPLKTIVTPANDPPVSASIVAQVSDIESSSQGFIHITATPTVSPTPIPPSPVPDPCQDTEFPPTCEENGYILHENLEEGISTVLEGAPALGHEWSEWTEDVLTGMMISTCSRCGKELVRKETYTGTIARIDFTGSMDGISKSDRVTLGFDFTSPTEIFSCYSYTTWQGHTALNFPKKNFTVRLYDDEEITEKHKLIFKNWQREHKYVLKANYRDISQARNLVAAGIWADMAATRSDLFETLRQTSNYGAVDGFPVIVYLNGDFIGLYTMNLHIDDDLFQMNDVYDAVMITNSSGPEEVRFYANAAFEDEKNAWEVEYCGSGDDNQWAKESLNALITYVMTSDDDTFRTHLSDHLDVNGAIDYLIFLYITGLQNNGSKDLVLLKYQDSDVWIPSVYDMEAAFGLDLESVEYISADSFLPVQTGGVWDSDTSSLLWDRLLQMFEPEIRARYTALRKTVFKESSLINRVNAFMDQIPTEYYEADAALYPRHIPADDPRNQMRLFIHEKLLLLDKVLKDN